MMMSFCDGYDDDNGYDGSDDSEDGHIDDDDVDGENDDNDGQDDNIDSNDDGMLVIMTKLIRVPRLISWFRGKK